MQRNAQCIAHGAAQAPACQASANTCGSGLRSFCGQLPSAAPPRRQSFAATFSRVNRCAALLQRALYATFGEFGLSSWEFDGLATLRRSGTLYCITPSALFSALMVTSGTMTHRLQRLEAGGLVAPVLNCDDARSALVKLSPAGLAQTGRALETHVKKCTPHSGRHRAGRTGNARHTSGSQAERTGGSGQRELRLHLKARRIWRPMQGD